MWHLIYKVLFVEKYKFFYLWKHCKHIYTHVTLIMKISTTFDTFQYFILVLQPKTLFLFVSLHFIWNSFSDPESIHLEFRISICLQFLSKDGILYVTKWSIFEILCKSGKHNPMNSLVCIGFTYRQCILAGHIACLIFWDPGTSDASHWCVSFCGEWLLFFFPHSDIKLRLSFSLCKPFLSNDDTAFSSYVYELNTCITTPTN